MARPNNNKPGKKNKHLVISGIFRVFIFVGLVSSVFILSSFNKNPGNNTTTFPPDTKDTIYIYDTVVYYDTTFVYDTIYYPENKMQKDTLMYKFSGKLRYRNIMMQDSDIIVIKKVKQNKRKKLQLLSLDILLSPLYSFQTFKSDFLYTEITNKNNNSVNPSLGSSLALNINYHRPYSTFTSGINFSSLSSDFSTISAKYQIDTIIKMKLTPVIEMKIDSVQFINIDTLIATGDTVYYYITDTTYNTSIDTNFVQTPDTVMAYYNNRGNNTYTYIEIPLIYSRNFYLPNINLNPEIGIITSFFVNSEGKIVSLTDIFQTDNLKEKPKFATVNLSLYMGLKTNYRLGNKTEFITSVYFRRNINSVFKDYPIISRFNSFGISFGLRYKILI